jgi:predicted nucleic acid-binding protein
VIVVDASVIVAMFLDESESLGDDDTFETLAEEQLLVPAHWHAEVGNAFVTNVRRGRLPAARLTYAMTNLAALNVTTQPAPRTEEIEAIVVSAVKSRLTYYDELYVRLAESSKSQLFSFDEAMRAAARQRGVDVVPA